MFEVFFLSADRMTSFLASEEDCTSVGFLLLCRQPQVVFAAEHLPVVDQGFVGRYVYVTVLAAHRILVDGGRPGRLLPPVLRQGAHYPVDSREGTNEY